MGYDLNGYKLKDGDTRQDVSRILSGETDEEDYQGLTFSEEEKIFINHLLIAEYAFEKSSYGDWIEYNKNCIQLSVRDDSIGIGVPYWQEAQNDMAQVFEIVKKITEQTAIMFWDPQSGEFLDRTSTANIEVFEYGLAATNEISKEKIKGAEAEPKPAWWQFWK